MSVESSKNRVVKNIIGIYERRAAAVFALSKEYAAIAWRYFRQVQDTGINNPGLFWHNRLNDAARRVFAEAFIDSNEIGWFIAHGVDYGVYLELANDRKHEALRPIVQRFAGLFFKAVERIYQ